MPAQCKIAVKTDNAGGVVSEALETLSVYSQPGLGSEGSVKVYNKTSQKYDQFMVAIDYGGPRQVSRALADVYPDKADRERVRVLDVGAGTGLVGVELQQLGFKNLDALDPSEGMLKEAANRGIYRKFVNEYVTENPIPTIEKNSYDAVVCSGSMGRNMMPCTAFKEFIRLVKPGGFIVNELRTEYLQDTPGFNEGVMERLLQQLESEGQWRQVSRTVVPQFVHGKDGLLTVHQVLAA